MIEYQPLLKKVKDFIHSKNGSRILFAVGIALILLVYFWTDIHKNDTSATQSQTQQEYAVLLERSIQNIVQTIAGKEATVLVTLESDGETIYADQVNTTTDTTENTASESVKVQKSDDTEHNYIIVETADGTQQALIVSKINPRIQGVAIVVPGISEEVQTKISDAVTTALDIASRKVCVISS